jgi:hypothetical protein
VSLDGVLYEVDAVLVGATVLLRYDPSRKDRPVQIWHEGKRVGLAKPVDTYANCFVKREHGESAEPMRLRDFDDDDSEPKGGA